MVGIIANVSDNANVSDSASFVVRASIVVSASVVFRASVSILISNFVTCIVGVIGLIICNPYITLTIT